MKIAILILLSIIPFKANAEWKELIKIDESEYYFNTEGIQRSGTNVFFWQLINDLAGSKRAQIEVNCSIRKYRILYFSSHSEKFANGTISSISEDPTMWMAVPPDTAVGTAYNHFCKLAELL